MFAFEQVYKQLKRFHTGPEDQLKINIAIFSLIVQKLKRSLFHYTNSYNVVFKVPYKRHYVLA